MVRAKADFSPLQREMDKTKREMQAFKQSATSSMSRVGSTMVTSTQGMTVAMGGLAGALAPATAGLSVLALGLGTVATAGVQTAMSVENSTTMINNSLGENAKEFKEWTSTVGASFGYSQKTGLQAGATFSNILGSFITDGKELTRQTEEMMKTVAVVSSYTGRNHEDVTERIRSGLLGNTESIEDLGIFVNVAMIESTQAFQKMANGKHWEQLDFRVQQQIRLMAILEQANKQYGNSLADTTSKNMNGLKVEWDNLMTYMGEALLPLVNILVKGLTKVVHGFGLVFKPLASFMKGLFGYKDPPIQKSLKKEKNLTDALTQSIKDQNKEKKKSQTLFGFDQINTLGSINSDIKGAGGVLSPTFPTAIDPKLNTEATELQKKVNTVSDGLKKIGEGYRSLLKGDIKGAVKNFADGVGTMWGAWTTKNRGELLTKAMNSLASATSKLFKGNFTGASKDFEKAMIQYSEALTGKKGKEGLVSLGLWVGRLAKFTIPTNTPKAIKDLSSSILGFMKAMATKHSGSGGFFDAWAKGFNNMIDKFNDIIKRLKEFKIGKFQPFKDLGYFGKIPQSINGGGSSGTSTSVRSPVKMATGGIVTRSTFANIGEAGREAVLPLENNTQWMDTLASKISGKVGNGSGDVIIQIGSKEFGRFAINEINKVNRQAGRNLIKV